MATTHIAFDLGLTNTGICWGPDDSDVFTLPAKFRSSPMTVGKRNDRFRWWQDTYKMLLLPFPAIPVWVEAPITHTKNKTGSIDTHLLHGILQSVALENRSNVHPVAPTSLKKWATGKGNANKDDMVAAARTHGWQGDYHDEADAWLLWHYVNAGAAT